MNKAKKYSSRIGCERYKMIISIKVSDLIMNKSVASKGDYSSYLLKRLDINGVK